MIYEKENKHFSSRFLKVASVDVVRMSNGRLFQTAILPHRIPSV